MAGLPLGEIVGEVGADVGNHLQNCDGFRLRGKL